MATAQSKRTHCPQGHPYDAANTINSSGRRYCKSCMYARWRIKHPPKGGPTREEEILASFQRGEGCWLWTGSMHNAGYGAYNHDLAHRLVYELLVGPIPENHTLDHTCHPIDGSCPGGNACIHRRCVRPSHLEPVSLVVNVLRGLSPPAVNARKTHCPQGHPYDQANTGISSTSGWRYCKTCNRERARRRNRQGR